MQRHWRITACLGVLGLVVWACSSDHDALKKKDPPGTGGAAGSDAGSDAEPDVASDAGHDVFVEPTGSVKVTFLHAVVDSPRVAFCFAKVVDGVPSPALGKPLPAGGLAWGASLSVTELEAIDFSKDDLLPSVVAGDFSLLTGLSCAEAIALAQSLSVSDAGATLDGALDASDADGGDAGEASPPLPPPPKLRAAELPVIPAGTFSIGYSLLFAAAGCIGGPAFSDPLETWICGSDYTPTSSTLTPLLLPLSRVTKAGAMGIQVVNAARAAEAIDVASSYPKGSSVPKIWVGDQVPFGAVAPRPPLLEYSVTAFGAPLAASLLEVSSQNSSLPIYTSSWKDALDLGGLADAKDGKTYALVLVGPRPNNTGDKWWNGPRLALLPADP